MPDSPTDPTLEQERLRLERERLDLDKQRLLLDNRFFNKHLGVILTALVSVAATIVSVAQVFIATSQASRELDQRRVQAQAELQQTALQKNQELELAKLEQERRWNLDVIEFLFTHKRELFSAEPAEIAVTRDLLLVAFPAKISGPLLRQLQATTEGPRRAVWTSAIQQAKGQAINQLLGGTWQGQFVYVSNGDTYGMDLEFRGSVAEPTVRMFNHGAQSWTGRVKVVYRDGDIMFDLPPNRFVLQLANGSLAGEVDQGQTRVANVSFARSMRPGA